MTGPLDLRHDPRLALVDDFLEWVTYVIAAVNVVYGALVIALSDAAWGRIEEHHEVTTVYDWAFRVPGAPESWAIVAVLAGLGMTLAQITGRWRLLTLAAGVSTLWFIAFGAAFVASGISGGISPAFPPSVVYFGMALLAAGRARMAWGWHVTSR